MDSIRDWLYRFSPIHEFTFGHTPFQVRYFKTTSQKGCREFEYWQQVLQLKTLDQSLREAEVEREEICGEIDDAQSWWPFWNRKQRRRKLARLYLRLSQVGRRIFDQEAEAARHIQVIESDYADLTGLTEAEIFAKEPEYWTQRLSRQVALGTMGAKLGISSGDLTAIAALPEDVQVRVFDLISANQLQLPPKGE